MSCARAWGSALTPFLPHRFSRKITWNRKPPTSFAGGFVCSIQAVNFLQDSLCIGGLLPIGIEKGQPFSRLPLWVAICCVLIDKRELLVKLHLYQNHQS